MSTYFALFPICELEQSSCIPDEIKLKLRECGADVLEGKLNYDMQYNLM